MFKGSIVAIVTPMLDSGEIDYDSYERLLDWHLEQGSDGIALLGTTGESATITHEERQQLIELSVTQLAGKIPLIVGTGTHSTATSIALTQQAKELGADAALLVTPYYNKPTQTGLYQHFKTIADAVSLPQILYNVPSRTGCDLLPETVIKLSHLSNIVAIKEATADVHRVKTITDSGAAITVLGGDDATALELLLNGGKGVISVAANVAPRAFYQLCQAALNGNIEEAHQINRLLQPLYEALFVESNPIPVKWALLQMQRIAAGIRLPLTPLAEKFHPQVKEALSLANLL